MIRLRVFGWPDASDSMAAIEVLPRRFIEVWQQAEYVSDVAQKLRLSKGACRMRARRYKNHYGVPLKELPTTRPAPVIDWDEMAEYARELAPEGHAEYAGDDENATETPTPAVGGSGSDPAPDVTGYGATGRSDADGRHVQA